MNKINWGSDQDFIYNYILLKSSRKMGQLYNCDKASVLNHAKRIGFNVNTIDRGYKLSQAEKQQIKIQYDTKTSSQLAQQYNVSRGMITKIWYDAGLIGKETKRIKTNQIDLTGKIYGMWRVLQKTQLRGASGSIYWKCQCQCGTIKNVLSHNLVNGASLSCGGHNNVSKGNYKISQLLLQSKIPYETQKKFETCKDKTYLPFDFYVNNQYLIEYDGKQHYEKINFFDYDYTHKHDLIKSNWCKQSNIPLIRIPYTHFDNLSINDLLLETSNFIQK